tara:strand:+ start:32597 stop:33505 length:909 start_codon:yes stop_codon:yes gene_type:complete
MKSYLLSWNPDIWQWEQLASETEKVLSGEIVETEWSVTKSDKPSIGDKFYLTKVGSHGRGIFACGTIQTKPYEEAHYNSEKELSTSRLKYVRIKFDLLVDSNQGDYLVTELELKKINKDNNIKQHWTPENSGISIKDEAVKYIDLIIESSKERHIKVDEESYFKSIEELDSRYNALHRNEQGFLRSYLFSSSRYADCCICKERYPVEFLVAAHIKKRSLCSYEEKRDLKNIVVSMCKFGCDELYERKHISVVEGLVVSNDREVYSEALNNYRNKIVNNNCAAFNDDNRKYFEFQHRGDTSHL